LLLAEEFIGALLNFNEVEARAFVVLLAVLSAGLALSYLWQRLKPRFLSLRFRIRR
jgi:hypothetical protein